MINTNLLFFQFSCRSNYTLAILLQFISCQTHPTEKTCRAMRFIFYPVLRVTVRIDMDQYHFIFLLNFIFLLTQCYLNWNTALFHSSILAAVMAMSELVVYGITRHFAPRFLDNSREFYHLLFFRSLVNSYFLQLLIY